MNRKDLHSYVPEAQYLEDKQRPTSRELWEDLAVLDAEHAYAILASRGERLPVGEEFFLHCPVAEEHLSLLSSLSSRTPRLLLPTRDGRTLLLFTDPAAKTGLLLAVRIPLEIKATLRALRFLENDRFLSPIPLSTEELSAPRAEDEEPCRRLCELFYYLSPIFSPDPRKGLWTQCLLMARLVGCPLEEVDLPVQLPPLSDYDGARLRFFLLCAFLSLRGSVGQIGARGDRLPLSPSTPQYRCAVTVTPGDAAAVPVAGGLSFLSATCFADLFAAEQNGGLRLELSLPVSRKGGPLRAGGASAYLFLSILIQPLAKGTTP